MYFIWSRFYCQFFNKEQLPCVLHFVMLQVASLCCCRTGYCNCTHRVLLKVQEFFFAHKTEMYWNYILQHFCFRSLYMQMEPFAFRIGPYKNSVIGMLALRAACCSKEVKTYRAVIILTQHSFSLPSLPPNKVKMYKAKCTLIRWDIVTSHLDLIHFFF